MDLGMRKEKIKATLDFFEFYSITKQISYGD